VFSSFDELKIEPL